MKKIYTACGITILTLLTLFSLFQQNRQTLFTAKEHFIPFSRSMANCPLKHSHRSLSKRFARKSKWKKVRRLYEMHILNAKPPKEHRIPKILHFLVSHPETTAWERLHPSYETILWTPEKIATLTLQNPTRYENARTEKEKREALALEILYQQGGIIVPENKTPLRSLDSLLRLTDLTCGLNPLEKETLSPRLSTELLAAIPHHPIIHTCLTTNLPLTKVFLKQIKNHTYKNVALPSSYLYPSPHQPPPPEAFLSHEKNTKDSSS